MNKGLMPVALWVLTVAFALAPPLLSVAPLGMAPLMIAAGVLAYAAERVQSGTWPGVPASAAAFFIAFIVWCALSLIWDINPGSGARKLIDIVLETAALLALLALAGRLGAEQSRRLSWALVGGMLAGLVLLAIEALFDFPLYRAVMGNNAKLTDLVEAKRSTDALPLLVWPACLALARLGRPWLGAVLAVVFAVASVKLTASSATLGMALSLVVFAACFASTVWVRRFLTMATMLAFAVILPLSIFAYSHGGTTAPWIKHSGQHRVEIWHFAAERTLERPLFGWGFNASRYVPNGDAVSQFLPPGQSLIPLHPHDAFLQVWLEIGAVGAIIVAGILLLGLKAIGQWPAAVARFALPGYAAGLVIAGLAFGIWQSWWMATLAFSAVAYRMIGPEHG
ncbi:MAG TPA: O-antigen ligase family protein [Alphaproteobacteria bacterium]|jgi:O-antigen ligase|nr:O-antigen ligase family protein [Alphaproteobacteria bacterium]